MHFWVYSTMTNGIHLISSIFISSIFISSTMSACLQLLFKSACLGVWVHSEWEYVPTKMVMYSKLFHFSRPLMNSLRSQPIPAGTAVIRQQSNALWTAFVFHSHSHYLYPPLFFHFTQGENDRHFQSQRDELDSFRLRLKSFFLHTWKKKH